MANANVGTFVWHEHLTSDPKAAIAFYPEVLGWRTQPFGDDGAYTMWTGSQGPFGGVMALPEEAAKMGAKPNWMAHVAVDDVDATAALVKTLGGKVFKEPSDIPTIGRFAVIADPQGAVISVFKSLQPMAAHDTTQEGEFCWNELLTTDSNAALEFYSKVFGWKVTKEFEMGPKGTYRFFGIGDKDLGGVMTVPKDMPMPPAWIYYTATSDIEAAIGRASKRGAKVMNGPIEVPGGGRVAQLVDPQGAFFALYQAPKK